MRRAMFALVPVLAAIAFPACDDAGTSAPGPIARMTLSAGSPPPFIDVPWPSDAYRAGGHVVAPSALDRVFPISDGLVAAAMSKLDGFSRFTPAYFWIDDTSLPPGDDGLPAPATIDPASLPADEAACTSDASSTFLLDLESGARVPCRAGVHDDRRFGATTRPVVAVGPARGVVLAPGHRYAAVLTSRVRDALGRRVLAGGDVVRLATSGGSGPIEQLYAGALRRVNGALGAALSKDGAAVVAVAPFTTTAMDRELFEARDVVDALPAPKLAWDAASLAPMGAARFGPDAKGFTATLDAWLGVVAPGAKLPDGADDPDTTLPVRAHDRIAAVGTAVYDSASFLVQRPGGYADPDDANFAYDARGLPELAPGAPAQKVWVTFAVPRAPMPAAGYPAVIAMHGSGGSRADMMDLANPLCARGWIVAAIDSITFGARAPEPQYQVDRGTDWESAPGATYRGPDGFADTVNGGHNGPADLFGDLSDFGAMRDQLRQAAIDDVELVRVLRSDPDLSPLATGGTAPRVDPSRIAYLGNSLGSIEGATAAAIVSGVRAWVLNVGGGGFISEAAPNAPDSGSYIGAAGLALFGYRHDFLTASHPMMGLFQWLVEAGDPLSYASYVVRDPQPRGGAPTPPRNVLQVEVVYDSSAADESGEALARALGLPLAAPDVGSNAGVRDVRRLDADRERIAFAQAAPDADGAIHDVPRPGVTAVLVQQSPGHHVYDLTRSRAVQSYRIPYALYDTGHPFVPLAPAKQFSVRCAYRALQATVTQFCEDAFAGTVPRVKGFRAPVRDYDDDGVEDAVDPDPSDPTIR